MTTGDLRIALDPRSIAIIGASDNPNKIGGRPLLYLKRHGFRGTVYPVNPARPEVQGIKSFPRLLDVPEAPDVAIIAVPGEMALQALEECVQAGVKIAIMMASGFGESDAENGKEQERRMAQRARAGGMRLIGPNTQGLANFGTGAIASFSTMFIETEAQDGPVGIVSQSGGMSVVPYAMLRQRGIGVRHVHATGNDADVTVCELAIAVVQDPDVKLLLLYLEGIPDPHHLAEAARIARERGVPIVALKSGRTAAGQAAARSHTGALANEDRVVDAFLEQLGIWRARDTTDWVEAAELYLKGAKPSGRRLVIVSNSGATCVLSADAASLAGLTLAPLSDTTQGELRTILPSFATTTNPVDITAALLSNSGLFGQILPVIARDPNADACLIGLPVAGQGYDVEAFARDSATFVKTTGKPLVVVAPQPAVAARFKAQGLPAFAGEGEAIRSLSQFIAHHDLMARAHPPAKEAVTPSPVPPGPGRMLNEAESLSVLGRAGIPVVPYRLCRSPEEAVAALDDLGEPVVVKGCSADVAHKSELGLVHLGLADAEGVASAFEACRRALERNGLAFEGVIVARMVRGRREMLIGAHRDPVFGPVVVVGEGGKYVEAVPDVRVLLPPFGADDVRAALGRLRIAPILAGVRGEPPMDVAALCEAAVAVGRLMSEPGNDIASLDLNPVLLGSEGEGCVAVDAVVFTRT